MLAEVVQLVAREGRLVSMPLTLAVDYIFPFVSWDVFIRYKVVHMELTPRAIMPFGKGHKVTFSAHLFVSSWSVYPWSSSLLSSVVL